MRRPTKIDRSKPDPKCPNCRGKGIYPLSETAGKYITIRVGSSKDPQPCKECHK